MTAENDEFPEWARDERGHDFEWIGDNLYIFWPAATGAYVKAGRGAIIVDTTQQPAEGIGHPFGYFAQAFVEDRDDGDAKRMVREYDPDKEFVIVLLKIQRPHEHLPCAGELPARMTTNR